MVATDTTTDNTVLEALCKVDNLMGYRYGFMVWLSFWGLTLVGLLAETEDVPARHFLAQGALMSSLSLLYFCYQFQEQRPASTPAAHAITCEAAARWILLANHGFHAVLTDSTLGTISVILTVAMTLFGVLNMIKLVYILHHPAEYRAYEEKQRGSELR